MAIAAMFLPAPVCGQDVPPDSARLARDLLERAVAAIGGNDALSAAAGVDAQFHRHGITAGPGQARDPGALVSTTAITRRLVLDLDNGLGHREGTTAYPGPVVFHTRTVARGAHVAQVDVPRWRTGTDVLTDATGRRAHGDWVRSLSAAVLSEAATCFEYARLLARVHAARRYSPRRA